MNDREGNVRISFRPSIIMSLSFYQEVTCHVCFPCMKIRNLVAKSGLSSLCRNTNCASLCGHLEKGVVFLECLHNNLSLVDMIVKTHTVGNNSSPEVSKVELCNIQQRQGVTVCQTDPRTPTPLGVDTRMTRSE
uniref:Uncharacterized protein n=1 Tax=Timema poppense TaxID=170557 RepID=A0A7R9H0U8_TIMPO|nr:unnamed protein product [Timema poppensis]